MKTIIKRELLENFKNFSFILLFIYSIVLFALNSVVFSEKYQNEITYYNSVKNTFSSSNGFNLRVLPKPSLLQFIAEGGDKNRVEGYFVRPMGSIRPSSALEHDSMMPNVPEPDWAFIIKIVFSLFIILMGYNSISGEKEQGTLRLCLSNPLSRSKLIMGKYFAIMITVTISLISGMIVNFFIMGLLLPEILTGVLLGKLLMVIVTTLIYLSIFTFLSLLISSIIHQSSLVLLVLMIVWILFAIGGDITSIIAQKITDVPSEMDIVKNYNVLNFSDLFTTFRQRVDRGVFETEEELIHEHNQIYIDVHQNFNKQLAACDNSINQRMRLSNNLSRFSPMSLFQFASEHIVGTGFNREENFLNDVKGFSLIYDNFLIDSIGKLPTHYDFIGPRFSVDFKGKRISLGNLETQKRDFDSTNVPIFQESKQSWLGIINEALLDLGGLLLWNIILIIGAFMAFNKADVR